MRILVAIASYGIKNDGYLSRLVDEYLAMPFDVHIVVLSNLQKEVRPGIEVVAVDLRTKDPWSLPFPHKQIFADRLNDYDLFIYSEDDTLITETNIRAFLRASAVLPKEEIPGFLRFERSPDGNINYPEVHGHFHWDPQSVRSRGNYTLARFTNEHSACYVLTREQLRRAIESKGFVVGAHQGKYDLLCTAATDPYTQCGFQKLICISHLEDFLIHHLPNRYVGTRFGVDDSEMHRQVKVLLQISQNGHRPKSLFETESKFSKAWYSKNYYEPAIPELLGEVPNGARSALSIGCGRGATEAALASKGLRVTAVPLDPVISCAVEAEGVKAVHGDFATARANLAGRQFDCLLLSNVLHLVHDPVDVIASFSSLLTREAVAIASVPNLREIETLWARMSGDERFKDLGSYEKTGVHLTSHGILMDWFRNAGMRPKKVVDVMRPNFQMVSRLTLGLVDPFLSSELIAVARKA